MTSRSPKCRKTTQVELGAINRLLVRDNSYKQMEAGNVSNESKARNPSGLRWRQEQHWCTLSPEALWLPQAEVMGDVLCRAYFEGGNRQRVFQFETR